MADDESRRAVLRMLGSLAALGAMGCHPQRPPEPIAVAPVARVPTSARLGWRWVPGQSFAFHSVVRRSVRDVTYARAEAWAYTAQSLDSTGLVGLHGTLIGFGATVAQGGKALPDPLLRDAREAARDATAQDVDLKLRLTGRLVGCSLDDFGAALPHQMLGLHLPVVEVGPGDSWQDPSLALLFARLLPVELPVQVDARTTFRAFTPDERGAGRGWQVALEHRGVVRTYDGGPVIHIDGNCVWDTNPGAIASRRVEVVLEGVEGPGVLQVELTRDRKVEQPSPLASTQGPDWKT